jgi:hypothetical protein
MRFGRLFIGAVLASIAVTPVSAQSSDPFQSNPGPAPAPAVQMPRPRPAPRPAPRIEREPPQQAAPVVAVPPPNPAQRFDGIWVGAYSCGAGPRNISAFQIPRTVQAKNGRFEFIAGVAPGTAGYWGVAGGNVSPDGSITMTGQSIGTGRAGAAPLGQAAQHQLSGRIAGEQLTATDLAYPERGCHLTLTRQH